MRSKCLPCPAFYEWFAFLTGLAPDLKSDLDFLKKKVDQGAEYVVTQMFFDNQRFFDFVGKCRKEGISVPIVPGLKPITTLKQVNALPRTFHIDLPEELSTEVAKCKDNVGAREAGIEWTIQQAKELIEFGVPCLPLLHISHWSLVLLSTG